MELRTNENQLTEQQARAIDDRGRVASVLRDGEDVAGETREQVMQVMDDMRSADIDFLTMGQYLQPTPRHAKVAEFVTPKAFDSYAAIARAKPGDRIIVEAGRYAIRATTTDAAGKT